MTAILQVALNLAITVADVAPSSPLTATPTLKLNGYNLVPGSTEEITSFYGRWTYLPGAPSMVQGKQQFDVVDPETNEAAGSFDALVSRGDGYNYVALPVTENDGINVGTEAGQTPPSDPSSPNSSSDRSAGPTRPCRPKPVTWCRSS